MATGADYEVVDVGSGEEITNPGANDVIVAFHKSTGALEKIDYNKLAKATIEQYTGSTIGGAAQSVKAAMDALNEMTTVTSVDTGIKGLYAFKMGNIVWLRVYDCAYNIAGTLLESLKPKSGVHFCAVSGSADRKVALVSINAAGVVDVSSQITSGYIYGSTVYMT